MVFSCMVQENQVPAAQRTLIESRLTAIAGDVFSEQPDDINVGWVEVKSGHGFTAAEPSTSSLALAIVPDGTASDVREKLLSAMSTAWMDVTACSVNEIVATAADVSHFAQASA